MSQPDLAYSFWSEDQPPLANPSCLESSHLLPHSHLAPFDLIPTNLPPSNLANYQSVLDELAKAQALDQERVARIYHLEQALDQALACLDELKLQVQDQAFLETQLATTEEFAYVQQQAIARLKLQLSQQRQMLEAQTLEVHQQNQAIQALLAKTEMIAQLQQQELERLRSRLAQDQVEIQQHRSQLEKQLQDLQTALASRQQRVLELEAESLSSRTQNATLEIQLNAAQSQIQQLCLSLSQHQASLANLEVQLVQVQTNPDLRDLAPSLDLDHVDPIYIDQNPGYDHQNPTIATLQQELVVSQVKVEELETQLAKQIKLQARWQQNFQELDAERDRYQSRIQSLEQESAEMQEQILQQARQTSEYETAIQHWKDRYWTSEQQFTQLRELLEQIPQLTKDYKDAEPSLAPFIAELLITIQKLITAEDETQASLPVPAPRLHPLELPDFLARRRLYRTR